MSCDQFPDSATDVPEPQQEKARTPGLRLFDVFLYPIVTNLSVFAISVAATYLTARGGDRNAAGKLIYGKLGEKIQQRGDWLMGKLKSSGLSHNQADMAKMVAFSFADGSLMAPVVKKIEDHREDIGCWIDHQLGTKPEDMSVYKKEPKQTWLSVLGGRFVTASIVVPTAVALDKTGLNDKLFNNPGQKMGEWLAKKPKVTKFFGHLDVKELSRIAFFEAFYTSVCTAGLYFMSRGIARWTGKKGEKTCAPAQETAVAAAPGFERAEPKHCATMESVVTDDTPQAKAHPQLRRPRDTKLFNNYREKCASTVRTPSLIGV